MLSFFLRRLGQAINYRESLKIGQDLRRIIWSESDGLPGVIVDQYGEHLVLQTTTLAMDQRKDLIVSCLVELLKPQSITLRNDSSMRRPEGLEQEIVMVHGDQPEPFTVSHQDSVFEIDPANGQKKLGSTSTLWTITKKLPASHPGRRSLIYSATKEDLA
jgi:23S rRNA (cytosine1962-C5)-methyltransferase